MIILSETVKPFLCSSSFFILFFHSFLYLWNTDSVVYRLSQCQGEIGNGRRWINWSSVKTRLKLYHLNIQFISEAENSNYQCSKARYMERNTESITGLCPALMALACKLWKSTQYNHGSNYKFTFYGSLKRITAFFFQFPWVLKLTLKLLCYIAHSVTPQWSQGGFKAWRNTCLALQDTSIFMWTEKKTPAANITINLVLWYWQAAVTFSH